MKKKKRKEKKGSSIIILLEANTTKTQLYDQNGWSGEGRLGQARLAKLNEKGERERGRDKLTHVT